MTLLQVIDKARALVNEPLASTRTFPDNTSTFFTDSVMIEYVNLVQPEIQQEIIQAYEDDFVTATFVSVVAGTDAYTLPTGFVKMRRVEDATNSSAPQEIYPVTMNTKGEIIRARDSSRTLETQSYYLRGNQIVFTDTPAFTNASAIRLYFVNGATDISAASSCSVLPDHTHRALVWGVVKLCLHQRQASQESVQFAANEYDKHLMKIRQQAEGRQAQRPRTVIRRESGDII